MSRTKRLLAVLLALCGTVLCGCGQRETETEELPVLVIGSDNYEPYFYLDEDGAYAGIDVEIAKAACERLGWTPDFRQISWQEKDALLERGDVDCLWGSFSMNGREDRYRWAGPYMYSRQVVIVQVSSDIYGLGDLNGKRIAVQTSSKPEELFLKHQVPGVEQVDSVYCFADTVDVFAALDKSYVDACAGHETAYLTFIAGRAGEYRVLEPGLLRAGLGAAFYKGAHAGAGRLCDGGHGSHRRQQQHPQRPADRPADAAISAKPVHQLPRHRRRRPAKEPRAADGAGAGGGGA